MWDELSRPLEDEVYTAAADKPATKTVPTVGGRTSLRVDKWDIEAEAKPWLQSHKLELQQVSQNSQCGCC